MHENDKEEFKNFKCPVKMDIDDKEKDKKCKYYDINGLNALIEDIQKIQSAIKEFMK